MAQKPKLTDDERKRLEAEIEDAKKRHEQRLVNIQAAYVFEEAVAFKESHTYSGNVRKLPTAERAYFERMARRFRAAIDSARDARDSSLKSSEECLKSELTPLLAKLNPQEA